MNVRHHAIAPGDCVCPDHHVVRTAWSLTIKNAFKVTARTASGRIVLPAINWRRGRNRTRPRTSLRQGPLSVRLGHLPGSNKMTTFLFPSAPFRYVAGDNRIGSSPLIDRPRPARQPPAPSPTASPSPRTSARRSRDARPRATPRIRTPRTVADCRRGRGAREDAGAAGRNAEDGGSVARLCAAKASRMRPAAAPASSTRNARKAKPALAARPSARIAEPRAAVTAPRYPSNRARSCRSGRSA